MYNSEKVVFLTKQFAIYDVIHILRALKFYKKHNVGDSTYKCSYQKLLVEWENFQTDSVKGLSLLLRVNESTEFWFVNKPFLLKIFNANFIFLIIGF